MSVKTDDKSTLAAGVEQSQPLRGGLLLVIGAAFVLAGLALPDTGAPAIVVDLLAQPLYYTGLVFGIVAPSWYLVGRPMHHITQL